MTSLSQYVPILLPKSLASAVTKLRVSSPLRAISSQPNNLMIPGLKTRRVRAGDRELRDCCGAVAFTICSSSAHRSCCPKPTNALNFTRCLPIASSRDAPTRTNAKTSGVSEQCRSLIPTPKANAPHTTLSSPQEISLMEA